MTSARGGTPQDDASLLGRTVGRYRLDASIGRGGMGEVFLGWDTRLEKSVAVKALRRDLVENPRSRERFVREARYACRVQHPFVCSVLDVVEDREELFLVMEHVEGLRFDDVIELERPSIDRVRDLAIEIAEALGAIHGASLVHRDLKPSNVMVTADGHVKVMDFGVARLSAPQRSPDGADATMTESGFGVGTVAYMSPEQIRGHKADARSDLFALGIVLYQAITGEHPFERGSPYATASAILNDPPGGGREPATLSTAGATRQIVLRLLEKSPALRYPSAEAVIDDLRAAKEGLRLAPVPKPRPFGAATAWTAAALVVAALAAGVAGYRACTRPPGLPPLVVVLPFGSSGGVGSERGAVMADLVSAGLADTGEVRRLSPEYLAELLAVQPAGASPADLRRSIAEATGARWILSGHVYRVGSRSEAAIDVHGGRDAPEHTIRVAAAGSSGLIDTALARLITSLALDVGAPATPPLNLPDELLDRYAEGVKAYREYRFGQAIAAFDAVIAREGRFAAARRWQVLALERAGFESRARQSAEALENLLRDPAAPVADSEADWCRAAIATARGSDSEGIVALRALLARRPDDVDAMRQLAGLLISAGQGVESVALLDRALELEPGFVALRLLKVRALASLSRFDEAEALLGSIARDVPERAVSVRASVEERWGRLRQAQGRLDEARAHFVESGALLQRAGHPIAAAMAGGNAVKIDLLQGNVADATRTIDPLLALARSEGCHRFAIAQLTALGAACFQTGRLAEAQARFREALGLAREIGNQDLWIDPATNLASLLSLTGRFGEARGLADEAARAARARGEPDRERPALVIRADALAAEGRFDEATAAFEKLADDERDSAAEGVTWARLGASETREIRGEFAASARDASRAVEAARKGARAVQVGYAAARQGETLARAGFPAAAAEAVKIGRAGAPVAQLPDLALRLDWVEALAAAYGSSVPSADRFVEIVRRARELAATEVEHSALVVLSETRARHGESKDAIDPARTVLDAPTARYAHRVRARVALARALSLGGDLGRATDEARRAFDEAFEAGMKIESAIAASLVVRAGRAPRAEIESLQERALGALAAVDAELREIRAEDRAPRWDIVEARATIPTSQRRP